MINKDFVISVRYFSCVKFYMLVFGKGSLFEVNSKPKCLRDNRQAKNTQVGLHVSFPFWLKWTVIRNKRSLQKFFSIFCREYIIFWFDKNIFSECHSTYQWSEFIAFFAYGCYCTSKKIRLKSAIWTWVAATYTSLSNLLVLTNKFICTFHEGKF